MAPRHAQRGAVGALAKRPVGFLVCFAVKQEGQFLWPTDKCSGNAVQLWLTGMGRKNASESVREAISEVRPERVLTCGFAGGLNPGLKVGDVIYDCDFDIGLDRILDELAAKRARFYCAERVVVTAEEKRALWLSTAADAVEMESSVIRTICREFKTPSATVRVISDEVGEDLPLDFNALMTNDDKISYARLALNLLSSPIRIARLIVFRRKTIIAARALAYVLNGLLQKVCR